MGNIKQDISFPIKGGLNLDDDLTTFPKGDWRGLENMRSGVSAGENEGQFESILSDIERTYSDGNCPAIDSDIMGGGGDLRTNKIYLFFKDTTNSCDWIIEYDIENKQYNIVWKDELNVLNFNTSYKIFNVNILDGILYWTDNNSVDNNPPRKLDIAKAKVTEANKLYDETILFWPISLPTPAGTYVVYLGYIYKSKHAFAGADLTDTDDWEQICAVADCYPEMGEQEIDVIAHPPLKAPTVSYDTDSTKKTNNLRGLLFQFAYRYVYTDYRKSTYSPASKVPLPQGEELTGGQFEEDITINNLLNISVNIGSPEVLRIEIVFRNSADLSTWYKVDTIDVYNPEGELLYEWGSETILVFYNNQIKIAVSTEDLLRPFDYVPLLAGCQEIIEENRLVYADITEGFLPTALDIASPVITKVDITAKESIIPVYGEEDGGQATIYFFKTEDVADYIDVTFYITQILEGVTRTGEYKVTEFDAWADVITNLKTDMTNKGMEVDACAGGGDICFNLTTDMVWRVYCSPIELIKTTNLKSGSSHIVGVVYYDRARRHGPVNIHDNLEFYLEGYNESGGLKVNEKYKVVFTLDHIPPLWAKYYQLVYAGNQTMKWFLQIRTEQVSWQGFGFESRVYIDIKTTLDNMQDGNKKVSIGNYEWQEGDRVRFIGHVRNPFHYQGPLDHEIEGIDSDGKLIVGYFYEVLLMDENIIIEVYRPAKESTTKIFNEIGQEYEVKIDENGHPYHEGDTDQVLDAQGENVTGAEVEFLGYDSFKYGRSDIEQSYWVESPCYSDYEENGDMYSDGFSKVEDPDAKRENFDTKYRWGGAYYLDTELNYISKFDYKNIGTLPKKFGKIQKIIEVGFVLKVLLSHKLYSLYIRRISYLDAVGEEKLTLTDSMFGTKRPEVQDWGTQNPESVLVHERYLYFWDRSVGKFLRNAANGTVAISDHKVKSFFKSLSLDNPTGEITCYTGYNNRFEELWVTLVYNQEFTTLRFSEYKERWDGIVNTDPKMYISILQDFYKVYQAKLYDASSDESQGYLVFANSHGNTYPIIEVIGNIDPYKIKIWNAIAVYSSHVFFAPLDTYIEIPASNNYPDGMKTRILEGLWECNEGVWYGPIMMDLNTPGAEVNKALNGRPMRGDVIKIRLRGNAETSEKTLLSKMIIHATPSERSKL